jgi:hypothetical protein
MTTTTTRRIRAAAMAFLIALSIARAALAEPTAADKATARGLLDDGYGLLTKGDAAGALKRFVGADALIAVPTTKLAIARAHLALGQLVEAQDVLTTAMRMPGAGPDEPGALKKARQDAAELLAQTTPRIAELTIALKGDPPKDLVLKVDGIVVPHEALIAPRRLNPGPHVIEAISGEKNHVQNATLSDGEKGNITVDLANLGASTSQTPEKPTPTPEPAKESGGRSTPIIVAGLVIGIGGLAVGTTTGVLALGRQSDAEVNGCVSNRCPPPAHEDVDAAQGLARFSTIGFIVGGVALAATITYWLLSGNSKPVVQKP